MPIIILITWNLYSSIAQCYPPKDILKLWKFNHLKVQHLQCIISSAAQKFWMLIKMPSQYAVTAFAGNSYTSQELPNLIMFIALQKIVNDKLWNWNQRELANKTQKWWSDLCHDIFSWDSCTLWEWKYSRSNREYCQFY